MPIALPIVGPSFLLSQVGAHAAHDFGVRLEAIGLTPQHAGILRLLGVAPGPTQRALAERLGVLPSRLVALLDQLEAGGFVERRRDEADRRTHRLHLTGEGAAALAEVGRITEELERDLFVALEPAERDVLIGFLRRVASQQGLLPGIHPAWRSAGS
ncbi:MAG: winged helix-turn-helix transcriptional regulator [Myxococcales bacterium]|nr:winged helix-turn-helix transcriptional regulator [Myxococcales bacterium]